MSQGPSYAPSSTVPTLPVVATLSNPTTDLSTAETSVNALEAVLKDDSTPGVESQSSQADAHTSQKSPSLPGGPPSTPHTLQDVGAGAASEGEGGLLNPPLDSGKDIDKAEVGLSNPPLDPVEGTNRVLPTPTPDPSSGEGESQRADPLGGGGDNVPSSSSPRLHLQMPSPAAFPEPQPEAEESAVVAESAVAVESAVAGESAVVGESAVTVADQGLDVSPPGFSSRLKPLPRRASDGFPSRVAAHGEGMGEDLGLTEAREAAELMRLQRDFPVAQELAMDAMIAAEELQIMLGAARCAQRAIIEHSSQA